MTVSVPALSAASADASFEKVQLERRDLRPDDVRIDIRWAGICHSDIHTKREEWGPASFPLTPGHEILGTVLEVGPELGSWDVEVPDLPSDVASAAGMACSIGPVEQSRPSASFLTAPSRSSSRAVRPTAIHPARQPGARYAFDSDENEMIGASGYRLAIGGTGP